MGNRNKKLNKEEFLHLLVESVTNINDFNKHMELLGVTVKPFTGYEYYYGSNFICSTEDLCVDDLLEQIGYEIE